MLTTVTDWNFLHWYIKYYLVKLFYNFLLFQATEQDDETTIVKDARLQASTGYQRLMAFRRPDGSFAQEIGDDAVSDVWLVIVFKFKRWLNVLYVHLLMTTKIDTTTI